MHDSGILDDLDYALVAALQLYPRAGWAELAPILATSPSTLSRRWEAMTSAGIAWSSAVLLTDTAVQRQIAMIEIICEPGQREQCIRALTEVDEVANLDTCAGERDILLTVSGLSLRDTDRLVDERISRVAGVLRVRTHYGGGFVQEGSTFSLGSLSVTQRRAIDALRPVRRQAQRPPTPAQVSIANALHLNARMSAAEIARQTGLSPSHVQRQLPTIESYAGFYPRTDISVSDFNLVAVYLWLSCPVDRIDRAIHGLIGVRGVRMIVPTVAKANLLLSVWLPSLDAVSAFEREFIRAFPFVEIADRWVQTSSRKRIGIILDEFGRKRPDTEG